METIKVWKGTKSWVRGLENSEYTTLEFTGREIGYKKIVDEYDVRYYTVRRAYETEDGKVVVHQVDFAPLGEDVEAIIFVYDTLDEAAGAGWGDLLK